MTNDPISDMLTRLRNANMALLDHTAMPHSKAKESIAKILKDQGYIKDYSVTTDSRPELKVTLKYKGRRGVIEGLRRVSRPGLRRYVGAGEIPRVLAGMGVAILSTSKGIMDGTRARRENTGGEVMCFVW
jgi:small subunit ribosomal protein S8